MKKIICAFFYFFLIGLTSNLYCQTTGKVEIIESSSVKELMQKQNEINSKILVKGYRIKIHFGTDKAKAKEIKAKFILKFSDISAYEKYDQPNFNIRVGDFRTKLEAYKALKDILIEFPGAFIVQDEIEMPPLQ